MSPKAKAKVAKGLVLDVLDLEGKKTAQRELPESVFNVRVNPIVIAQAVRYYRTRMRGGTAAVKDRSAVRGSGRKIYAQKHTGRARHADRQAPQFVGGGRAHGPKPHRSSIHFSHRLRHMALRAVLSDKLRDGRLHLISSQKIDQPSTKLFRELPALAKFQSGKNLYVFEPEAKAAYLSVRNLPDTSGCRAMSLTAYDVLASRNIVLTEKALDLLARRLEANSRD